MLIDWVLFPLVLLIVVLGCGLLVERAGGWQLPGPLLPAVGLALLVVVVTVTTQSNTTAPWSTGLAVLLAVVGYVTSWERLRATRLDSVALLVGLAVFAVYAAPVVLSGSPTFLGYFVNNDSAFHFALIDQLLTHGTNLSVVPPSAYGAILHTYLDTAYPTGADVALGAIRPLVGQDVAWVFQPYLAVVASFGGLAVYELLRELVPSTRFRALCAFISAQAGLVYAFYLEDSIKEIVTTVIITVTVTLVVATLRRSGVRRLLPLVIVAVAGLDVLDVAVVPWLGIPLAVFVVWSLWRARLTLRRPLPRRVALETAALGAFAVALCLPVISRVSTFFSVATTVLDNGTSNTAAQLGNLAAPLQHWQVFGIWPTGDFRDPLSTHSRIGYALIGIAIASAVLGALWTVRRRAVGPGLLLVGNSIAALYLLGRSSPYASAKVMMIFSLTAVLTALLGGAALRYGYRRLEGWLLALVIAGATLWTNGLAYSNASPAPRGRLEELTAIGSRFQGQGLTLYNQADEFALHFLRKDDLGVDPAVGAVAPRPGLPPRGAGQGRLPWDPDDLAFGYLEGFRLLVLGRSPRISRPPANYSLVFSGRYYDVWKRTAASSVLEHIPLGGGLYPSARPSCQLVLATASRAERLHARLAFVVRPPAPAFVPTRGTYPPNWGLVAGDPYEVIPRDQPGAAAGALSAPASGTYQVWLEAALGQRFTVWVGGHDVGSVSDQLGPQGQFVRVGEVSLPPGRVAVKVVRSAPNLAPAYNVSNMLLGPLMLVREPDPPPVTEIAPAQARSVCGRWLDWLEIVR